MLNYEWSKVDMEKDNKVLFFSEGRSANLAIKDK